MSIKYVPILKWKRGEQNALKNLSNNIKEKVMPLIEVPFTAASQKGIQASIESMWPDKPFFFYLTPEWYGEEENTYCTYKKHLDELKTDKAVPVFDLSNIDSVADWTDISKNGVAIRVRNNEFGLIESDLNSLFSTKKLSRNKTDLILDLRYVTSDDLFAKTAVLKATFSDLDRVEEYHSIIISSGSFPQQLPPMDSQRIYHYSRKEVEVHAVATKLSKRINFNYIYSDYGPTDLEDFTFVVGMSPNFKIKYTTFDEYLYIKGLAVKKGGLDIENITVLCNLLVNCGEFSGATYSWGDSKIYELSEGQHSNGGNLTTWVSYSLNHHITLITEQV